ncbi:MAG: hypothetical protein ACMUEK_00310 [Sodalis sp. (in: enterobacteria)]
MVRSNLIAAKGIISRIAPQAFILSVKLKALKFPDSPLDNVTRAA